jgi:multiple antibiotic resistance protein
MSFIAAFVLIFMVLDPLGNVPMFLFVLQNIPPERRKAIIIRELLFALVILMIFLFTGRYILDALRVTESSLGIAGGVILMLIAIRMVFSSTGEVFAVERESEPLIFPLAVPLTAGPAAMTTVILIMGKDPSRWWDWLLALFCAWFISSVILFFSSNLNRLLGRRGLLACERLMGMLLTTVAVQMFIDGLRQSNIL